MGRALYEAEPRAREVFDKVGDVLGISMERLCFESDEATLRQTQNTQIALFTCAMAAWHALQGHRPGWLPSFMAGHSVGEYAALVAGGWLRLDDGARLVRRRGELMAASGRERPGSMAAVLGMDIPQAEELCKEVEGFGACVVANDNCPGQLVISGDKAAVEEAARIAPMRGAKRAILLNVSGAFHSPLMEASAEQLAVDLRRAYWTEGSVPVVSNVTARPEFDWAGLLEQQLKRPVRWREGVEFLADQGLKLQLELGCGEVLCNLLKRTAGHARGVKVVDADSLQAALVAIDQEETE